MELGLGLGKLESPLTAASPIRTLPEYQQGKYRQRGFGVIQTLHPQESKPREED